MTPIIHDAVLYGAQDVVLAYMRARLPVQDYGNCLALGLVRDGELKGGVVFNNWHPGVDIEITAAVDTAHWARPRTVRRIFSYPFEHLGLPRVTLCAPRKNKAARAFAIGAGFRLEGVKRRAFDGRQDQMLYGLLREECRYLLLKGSADGQRP